MSTFQLLDISSTFSMSLSSSQNSFLDTSPEYFITSSVISSLPLLLFVLCCLHIYFVLRLMFHLFFGLFLLVVENTASTCLLFPIHSLYFVFSLGGFFCFNVPWSTFWLSVYFFFFFILCPNSSQDCFFASFTTCLTSVLILLY